MLSVEKSPLPAAADAAAAAAAEEEEEEEEEAEEEAEEWAKGCVRCTTAKRGRVPLGLRAGR